LSRGFFIFFCLFESFLFSIEHTRAKNKPKSAQEQEAIGILRNDPQMRAAFINKIAAPIANKMFECGMIP